MVPRIRGVRERQLQIDLSRGYERLVPIEYYDLGSREMERVILFQNKQRGYEKVVP